MNNDYDLTKIEEVKRTGLLIAKEKHGDVYYVFSNLEELNEICLYLVASRYKWYTVDVDEPVLPDGISDGISDEKDIDKLPEWMREAARIAFKNYKYDLRHYNNSKAYKILAEKAKNGDASAAKYLLEYRLDHEYEGFEIEYPLTISELKKRKEKINDEQ